MFRLFLAYRFLVLVLALIGALALVAFLSGCDQGPALQGVSIQTWKQRECNGPLGCRFTHYTRVQLRDGRVITILGEFPRGTPVVIRSGVGKRMQPVQ